MFKSPIGNICYRFSGGGGEPTGPPLAEDQPAEGTTPQEPLYANKFSDPRELEKAYITLEEKLGVQGQELGALRQQAQQLQQLPQIIEQRVQSAMEAQAQKLQQQPLTPEQKREINEELLDQFNEDPSGFLENWRKDIFTEVQGELKKQYEPLEQKVQHYDQMARWNQQVQQVMAKYPDYAQMVPAMQQVIEMHGNSLINAPNGVEMAYLMAKGMNQPENLLQDQTIRQQIMSNQEIRNEIIADYMKQVREGNAPPVVIGGQPAGASPTGAPTEIKTARDASKASLSIFQKFLGGG